MRLSWPLIGRTEQMAAIESSIAAPDSAGVVVAGAAGVGKSRLARETLAVAHSRGFQCRWVMATSSASAIPLGAFAGWTTPGHTDAVAQVRGVVEALTGPAGAPVVVGVDDAHLLDELSIFAVHQLVHQSTATVLLTVRTDAPIPAALREIWHTAGLHYLELEPLDSPATAALLTQTLPAPVEPAVVQRLWQLTRGNAAYLRSIVEHAVADGRLAAEHGRWRWRSDPMLPPDLVGRVESQIGPLHGSLADVIDVVAVAEPLNLATLIRITDPAAIEEAEERNLITVEPGTAAAQVAVADPLYGEIRRRRAPRMRLRRLRGLVATELAKTVDSTDIQTLVKRATLSIDSDLSPDSNLLMTAAHGAMRLADLHTAEHLAGAAIAAGAGEEASFVRAQALSSLGRGEEADTVLDAVTAPTLSDAVGARLAFLRSANMLWVLGRPDRAREIIDQAAGSIAPHSDSYLDAALQVYQFALDQPRAALQASRSIAPAELPPVAGAEITWALTTIAADEGRTGDAVAIAQAGIAMAVRSLDALQTRFNIADAQVSALLLAGRITEAREVADRTHRQAVELPGPARFLGAAIAGRAELGAGCLTSAADLLNAAVRGLSDTHALGWGCRYLVPTATVLAIRGDLVDAADALRVLDTRTPSFRSLDCERSLARAWLTANQGTVSEAITVLRSAAQKASAQGQFAAEVMCLQTAIQFGEHRCRSRMAELERLVDGPRAGMATRFATALHDGDATELAVVSDDYEQLGDLLAAVDAAAHAALAYRAVDRRGSALGCSSRALALARRCGGISTPALCHAADPVPLTGRAREIVALIGQGLSNRDVAERLTLSVRTVESHIYRAMARTGTHSRGELASLLARHHEVQ